MQNIHLRSGHVVVANVDSQVVGRVLIALAACPDRAGVTCSYWPPVPGQGQTEGSPRSPRGHREVTEGSPEITKSPGVTMCRPGLPENQEVTRRSGKVTTGRAVQSSIPCPCHRRVEGGRKQSVRGERERGRRQPCRRSRKDGERVVQSVYTCCVLSRLQSRPPLCHLGPVRSSAVQGGPGWSGDQCRRGGGSARSSVPRCARGR